VADGGAVKLNGKPNEVTLVFGRLAGRREEANGSPAQQQDERVAESMSKDEGIKQEATERTLKKLRALTGKFDGRKLKYEDI